MLTAFAAALAVPAGANATIVVTVPGGNTLNIETNAADLVEVTCNANGKVAINQSESTADCNAITTINVTATGDFDNEIDLSGVVTPAFPQSLVATVNAGPGNDTVVGTGVADGARTVDTLNGEDGNDRLTGFRGSDTKNGGDGDDTMTWNNGDGTDVNNGGAGNDTSVINGANAAGDAFEARPGAVQGRVQFNRTNLVPFGVDISGDTENLRLNGLGGDDTITGSPGGATGLGALIALAIDGGDGNDVLTGGDGADVINGGAGNDALTGFRGADTKSGGDGDDTMTWNNGDGSDVNNGDAGNDTSVINGSNAAGDAFEARPSATPGRVQFNRTNLVPFSVDIGTTENLRLNGLGGDDTINASPGGATGLAQLIAITIAGGDGNDTITGGDGNDTLLGEGGNDSLTGFRGADTKSGGDGDDTMTWNNGDGSDVNNGDAGNDTSVINGSNAAGDAFEARPSATPGRVQFNRTNLVPFSVDIGTTEALQMNGLDGDDSITAGDGLAALIGIAMNGNAGNDTLTGGDGAESINGGADNDTLTGGLGADVVAGESGADTLRLRDGVQDNATCGSEADNVQADANDTVAGDCELVDRGVGAPPPPPPVRDRVGPRMFISAAPVRLTRSGLARIRVACPRSEIRCVGTLTLRTARRVVIRRAVRRNGRIVRRPVLATVRLGSKGFRLNGGRSALVSVRLNRANRALIARLRSVRVRSTIVARDAAGNRRTTTRLHTLRAPLPRR